MFKNYAFSWRIIRSGQEFLLALRKEIEMNAYRIVKAHSETFSGRIVQVWHVVDAADGYVYDSFDLKRDAAAWIAASAK